MYLTFTRDFEVSYNPRNVVAVDVNENNATVALFIDGKLHEVYRVETGLGRTVIAYAERRKITEGKSTKTRSVKKILKKLRERERKNDIVVTCAHPLVFLGTGSSHLLIPYPRLRELCTPIGEERFTS